jgi:hypothetical protein
LTLARTVRLLRAALEIPELTVVRALQLLEYYIHRNKIALRSHTKTWISKHEEIAFHALRE